MKHLSLFVSVFLLLSASVLAKEAVIYSFQGGNDGQFPRAGLVADNAGNFFGTTEFGGTGSCSYIGFSGCGTVFELSPNGEGGWVETVLYSFQGQADGQWPLSALVVDTAGNLYGTSQIGGGTNFKCPPSCGSAFELSPGSQGWTFKILHAFKGGKDGGGPQGGLVADTSGNLYGVTYLGGTSNGGTFYQLVLTNGTWVFKKLHNFGSMPDGWQPNGTPLLGKDGSFYGTTALGGEFDDGILYQFYLAKAGKWREKIIHSFGSGNGNRGAHSGELSQDTQGNLYGISEGGRGGLHYAYRMSLINGKWKRKNIHRFDRGQGDGVPNPYLTIDSAGDLFGTASDGPDIPFGKVYMLSASGDETVLYRFKGQPDGEEPASKLLLDQKGDLWGTTAQGGNGTNCNGFPGCGTIFKITR